VDTSQPAMLMPPNGARDAGSRNTPDAIMLPMTSDTAVQNPITRIGAGGGVEAAMSAVMWRKS
jgi:hypothetical protein